jgi:hypothetical protein
MGPAPEIHLAQGSNLAWTHGLTVGVGSLQPGRIHPGCVWRHLSGGQEKVDINMFFHTDVFKVMIFTDVLIVILSLVVSGRYELVFRNSAQPF